MAMDWLKGLVGPVAQFSPTGQPIAGPGGGGAFPPGYAPSAGPPIGGAPPPGAWTPPAGAPGGSPGYGAGMPGVDQNAFGAAYSPTPSYGSPPQTPSYGAPQTASYGAPQTASYGAPQAPNYGAPQAPNYGAPQAPGYGTPQAPGSGAAPQGSGLGAQGGSPADARVVALENKCEEMRRDLESLALFAQTLLTVLEDKKVMTTQDFQEARRRLDLLDGRLDDRIAKAPGA